MTLEELTQTFIAAATPELAKLAADYVPVAEHVLEAGAGAALGAASTEYQKLRAYAEQLAQTVVAHHAFLAHLIPALAAHGISLPADLTTTPPPAPTLTAPAEEQAPATEATA